MVILWGKSEPIDTLRSILILEKLDLPTFFLHFSKTTTQKYPMFLCPVDFTLIHVIFVCFT